MIQLWIRDISGNRDIRNVAESSDLYVSSSFQAFKTSVQTSTLAWSDIVSWDVPIIIDSDYIFDSSTGVLTIQTDGRYKLTVHSLFDAIGNNRVEGAVKLQRNNLDLPLAEDRQYLARNNTQDIGSVQINNYLIDLVSSDTLKIQEQRVGATADIISSRFTIEKIN